MVRVFAASPGDVAQERAVVEGVVREMNDGWTADLGYRVGLVRWETDTYPGFADAAQDVVNQQIGDDYDVFIGIMWARVGTPTDRSESGTVEEFERAYARFKADPTSVHLMMYFKNGPLQPDQIDPFQLVKVNEFKQRVADLGGFYREFLHSEDFERLVRSNLSQYLRDRRKKAGPFDRAAVPAVSTEPVEPKENTDDRGYLDLAEEAEAAFAGLNATVTAMTGAIEELGSKTAGRSNEMQAVAELPPEQQRKAVKRIAKASAEDMDEYVAKVEAELPVYKEKLHTALDCFGRTAGLTADFTPEDTAQLEEARDTAASIRVSMSSARESMSGFRESVVSVPRITTVLNRAKRRVIDVTDTLIMELANGENLAGAVESDISRLISQLAEDSNE
jgi:Tfp pilus assembly protein PilO